MNTNTDTQNTPPAYWFGVIEHNLRASMRDELSELGLRRGSWRILHTLADGPASVEDIQASLPRRRNERRGRGSGGRRFGRGFRPGFGQRFGFSSDDEGRAFFDKKREEHGHPPFASDEERAAFFAGMRASRFARGERRGHGFGHDHGPADGHDHGHGHVDGHSHHEHPEHGQHEHNGDENERVHHDASGHPGHEHHGHEHHGHVHHGRSHGGEKRAGRAEAVLGAFSERGWVTFTEGVAELTPEGRAAHDDALERIRKLRTSVADGISAEDYATTMATLEAMARNLGWDVPKGPRAESSSAEDGGTRPEQEPDTDPKPDR